MFFRLLSLYLTRFAGQPCSAFQATGFSRKPVGEARQTLVTSLGVGVASQVKTTAGTPALSGFLERAGDASDPELLLRLDEPAPGIARLFAMATGEQVLVSVRLFLYGDGGVKIAGAAEQQWNAWLARQVPAAHVPS